MSYRSFTFLAALMLFGGVLMLQAGGTLRTATGILLLSAGLWLLWDIASVADELESACCEDETENW